MKIGADEHRPLELPPHPPPGSNLPDRWRIAIEYILKNRARILLRITQAWLLLLIVGSLQPARPGAVVSVHREIHWLGFACPTFFLLLLSRNRRQEIRILIGVFLLGLSLEYLQHLFYRNPMEWWDVRDDAFAILAAFALYRLAGAAGLFSQPPVAPESATGSPAGDGRS
jgi:hypothetical protein